jgi:hypothetical protein
MPTTTSQRVRYDFPHRMLMNLAATAWVATLMIPAYYVFSALATLSWPPTRPVYREGESKGRYMTKMHRPDEQAVDRVIGAIFGCRRT